MAVPIHVACQGPGLWLKFVGKCIFWVGREIDFMPGVAVLLLSHEERCPCWSTRPRSSAETTLGIEGSASLLRNDLLMGPTVTTINLQ